MTPEELSVWEPFLKTIPLFAGLSGADIARVGRRLQALSLPKGATLYSEGSPSDAFYIITSGSARVSAFDDFLLLQPRLIDCFRVGVNVDDVELLSRHLLAVLLVVESETYDLPKANTTHLLMREC